MRKRVLSLVAALATAVLAASGLTACGSGDGAIVFRIWDEEQLVGYQKSIKVFMAKNPKVKVKVEQLPYPQYWSKLTTEFAAGKGPDVYWNTVSYFGQLARQGVLAELDPLIQKDKFDMKQFYPQVVSDYTYQGKKYGMPADFGIASMIYNKDLLAKEGITAPGDLTWAPNGSGTLLAMAQKLTVDVNGKHPNEPGFNAKRVARWGFMAENHNQTQYVNWIPQNGGKLMTGPFGKFAFNQPKAVEALQWQVDLINKWHVSPPPSAGDALDLFNRGQVAMYPAVNALLPYVVPKVNFKVGIASLPAGPKGRIANVNGLSFALNANSGNSEASWALVKWLASPESQKIMGEGGYVWPANKSLASTYFGYWSKRGQDLAPYQRAAEGKTVSFPITPVWNAAELKIDNTFGPMFEGQQPVQSTTNTLVGSLNQLITDQG